MMRYVVSLAGREEEVSSPDQLESWLRRLQEMPSADLWLVQKKGSMKGIERLLYRMLGLATELDGDGVHLLTTQDKAAVTFVDEDDNEYHLSSRSDRPDSTTQSRTTDGLTKETLVSECLSTEEAVDAVRHFFRTGKRPERYSYRLVK